MGLIFGHVGQQKKSCSLKVLNELGRQTTGQPDYFRKETTWQKTHAMVYVPDTGIRLADLFMSIQMHETIQYSVFSQTTISKK